MTTKKVTTTGKGERRNLKLKKETITDLAPKKQSAGVKGGWFPTATTSKYEQSCRSCAACIQGLG
jgi:hypothetical protein